jgi:transcriptional regulator with XRE-family HTH domain
MNDNIHDRLKQARKYLNLSQEYVATQMALNRTAVTAIELGQRNISYEE